MKRRKQSVAPANSTLRPMMSAADLEEALRQLAVAQRYRPEDPWICLRRADMLAAQKKQDEALENVREAIRLRPSFWEAHYLLGVELDQNGKARQFIENLNRRD